MAHREHAESPALSWLASLRSALEREEQNRPKADKFLKYGTAGFRDDATKLPSAFFRVGMLAALRSASTRGAVGVMVTASHNKEADNGVKIIDPHGGMLDPAWEGYAIGLANADSVEALTRELGEICVKEGLKQTAAIALKNAEVLIGRDTRSHSPGLALCVAEGASLLGGRVQSFGLLSTPQLHTIVRNRNVHLLADSRMGGDLFGRPSWASEDGYYAMLAEAFHGLVLSSSGTGTLTPMHVDCAGGVGGYKITALRSAMARLSESYSSLILPFNVPGDDGVALNEGCGAEFVQKQRLAPFGVDSVSHREMAVASIDGDADRIVFHFFDETGKWHLLDGDKIATLLAEFLLDEMKVAGLAAGPESEQQNLEFGCVQTAYANGASSAYLAARGVPLRNAKTGVKYCHHVAEQFDVGCYFEANGHGTVIFSAAAARVMEGMKFPEDGPPSEQETSLRRVLLARQLINQTVGDAFSDLLAVQAILYLKGWSITDWDAVYEDLPSRQSKLPVQDRSVIRCNATETRVEQPSPLQAAIDASTMEVPSGRAFVRPSGTEDVVRVYAEAATAELADALALEVAQHVWDHCAGTGERPAGPAK